MPYLNETLKIEILMMIGFGDRMRTQNEVAALFQARHPDLPPLRQSTVSKIERQFRINGHVRNIPRQRPQSVSDNTKLDILLTYQETPITPARQVAREHDLSHKTVVKILKSAGKRPFKMKPVQELQEDDPDRRVEFCETMMNLVDSREILLNLILFSDEATFTLNGEVNRHNCRYYAETNPHWIVEQHTQHQAKINVWAGIIGDRIIGPVFFDQNLTGDRYLEFLQYTLVPELRRTFPSENGNFDERIYFQQDGAPPHYAANVREFLNTIFQNRWIGRRGTIEWPARSPDLTPLDFYLWGYLKNKVYVTKPRNIEELKQMIRQEIQLITPQVLRSLQGEFYHRLALCQEVNGLHFEQLLNK